MLCNKFQINWKNCLVSRTFLAHYFFNKFHFYCSCVYFSMLLFRVSFQLYHLLLLCKINFRHTKEKGRFSCIIQPFPVGLYSPLWVRTRCSVIRRSHTDLKTQQFQLRILHLAPNSNIRIRNIRTLSVNFKYLEENVKILEPKSTKVFLKKAKKIDKHIAILDSKQPGETGKSIYYNLLIY